jgi:hypothetical protein
MSDTRVRIGRRADGTRRVGTVTAWVAAGCTVLATTFGFVFAAQAQPATTPSPSQGTTNPNPGTGSGGTLQAPTTVPKSGSGRAHTGSGGS